MTLSHKHLHTHQCVPWVLRPPQRAASFFILLFYPAFFGNNMAYETPKIKAVKILAYSNSCESPGTITYQARLLMADGKLDKKVFYDFDDLVSYLRGNKVKFEQLDLTAVKANILGHLKKSEFESLVPETIGMAQYGLDPSQIRTLEDELGADSWKIPKEFLGASTMFVHGKPYNTA